MSEVSLDGSAVRAAYRALCGDRDPATPWLASGMPDARFGSVVNPGEIVRGQRDLIELHSLVDVLFGTDALPRPPIACGKTRQNHFAIARPAAVVPLLEALRPHLEHRGPGFWTWKSAREALAWRLTDIDGLTVEAVRVAP